jgi:hypothetical protein
MLELTYQRERRHALYTTSGHCLLIDRQAIAQAVALTEPEMMRMFEYPKTSVRSERMLRIVRCYRDVSAI